MTSPRTLPEKVWERHLVRSAPGEPDLLYIDLHLVHEVTSPQAFDGLRLSGRKVRRPELTVATEDHNVPTEHIDQPIADPISARQVEVLRENTAEFGITNFPMGDPGQGIVHVIGPEQGRTLPGMTIVCGDSHTATHGAFGALAFGIGTSEVEHVLATQTLPQTRPKWMSVEVDGDLPAGVTAKDVILAVIGQIGTGGGIGHVIEYRGVGDPGAVDGGPHDGLQHVDRGRRQGRARRPRRHDVRLPRGPRPRPEGGGVGRGGRRRGASCAATTARSGTGRCTSTPPTLRPQVSWGTNPGQVTSIDGAVPSPDDFADPTTRETVARALEYMGLTAGTAMRDIPVDTVFIGSCTNSRIEDLRAAAAVLDGRHVTAKRVMVVPGSHAVKAQAEAEGLHRDLHRRRRRLARARLLDVPGHEPRQAGARRALGEHQQPQLRGAPGPRRAHPPRVPRRRRRHRGGRPLLDPGGPVMKAVNVISGTGLPLKRSDVDTDQIIPAEWLKRVERTGFEKGLFATWRDDRNFVLNDERYAGASIIVAGPAFGVGSSREHAVWAILQAGFDAVIAPSFSDIFRNNCTKNGLVPVVVSEATVQRIWDIIDEEPQTQITVDVERLLVEVPTIGLEEPFPLDAATQERFLNGLDDVGITLAPRRRDRRLRSVTPRPG